MLKKILIVSSVFASGYAFADGFTIAQLNTASVKATDKFQADHAEHVAGFVGYKSWKSDDDAKVKVYVTHDGSNMEFNYVCHNHESGIECHDN